MWKNGNRITYLIPQQRKPFGYRIAEGWRPGDQAVRS